MTDLRKAAEMALEALELHAEQYPHMIKGYTHDAAEALRQALAQPEQKREWVGLTDEERFLNDCRSPEEIEYAIAIEAKLKDKNT